MGLPASFEEHWLLEPSAVTTTGCSSDSDSTTAGPQEFEVGACPSSSVLVLSLLVDSAGRRLSIAYDLTLPGQRPWTPGSRAWTSYSISNLQHPYGV